MSFIIIPTLKAFLAKTFLSRGETKESETLPEMGIVLAVHDSLRRGAHDNLKLIGGKYLGRDIIPGRLYDLGEYCVLIDPDNKAERETVVVDLYEVPLCMVPEIDKYEGYFPKEQDQNISERFKTMTEIGCLEVFAYRYIFEVPEKKKIPTGDWFDVYEVDY